MSILKDHLESFEIDYSIPEIKQRLNETGKLFFLKWTSDNEFKMSLNFSIGSSFLDVNRDSKSSIIANGHLFQVSTNRTQVNLSTKFKSGLLLILCIPIVMLILELTLNLGIPIPFYFVFPVFFFVFLFVFRSEEKRLIRYFKSQVGV